MEIYEKICPLGEGTYGMVMKCKHKDSGQVVAIKKFKDSEDDPLIRKTALREVKMLKQMKNDHIVNLLEVFRKKGKLYLVFEHLEGTILQHIEKFPKGIPDDPLRGDFVRKSTWQVLKAIDFLHSHNVIHRDLKPENILVSNKGTIKLCDFGFARSLNPGAKYTDYVATRWYRAPELLVGDTEYGRAVDIWAIGCIFSEMLTGQPLFPGDTDLDQLYRIMKCFGPLIKRHTDIFNTNPFFANHRLPDVQKIVSLSSRVPLATFDAMSMLQSCLALDPELRSSSQALMGHIYFTRDKFHTRYEVELQAILEKEREENVLEKLFSSKKAGNSSGNNSKKVDTSSNLYSNNINKKSNGGSKNELNKNEHQTNSNNINNQHGANSSNNPSTTTSNITTTTTTKQYTIQYNSNGHKIHVPINHTNINNNSNSNHINTNNNHTISINNHNSNSHHGNHKIHSNTPPPIHTQSSNGNGSQNNLSKKKTHHAAPLVLPKIANLGDHLGGGHGATGSHHNHHHHSSNHTHLKK